MRTHVEINRAPTFTQNPHKGSLSNSYMNHFTSHQPSWMPQVTQSNPNYPSFQKSNTTRMGMYNRRPDLK